MALPGATLASTTDTFTVHGFGKATVGGAGGRVIRVTNLKDSGAGSLRAALGASGPRIVRFDVAGIIDLVTPIKVTRAYVTIDGASAPSPGIQIRGESLVVGTHDVIIRYVRFRPGDRTADSPGSLDGLTINGASRVVLDHIDALWGPDVGGLAILNGATDITVQYSILGEGLLRSRHPEAWEDKDGHSMALNIVGLSPTSYPRRVTIYRNLITTSQTRNPKVAGADQVDVVNNVIYNFAEGPYGNPRDLNLVNNLLRTGPAPSAAGLKQMQYIWLPATTSDFPRLFSTAVYVAGNVTDGMIGTRAGPSAVYTASPAHALSVEPEAVGGLLDRVLRDVGATRPTLDAVSKRLIRSVRERTGHYMNGYRGPEPTTVWP
jgi:hypothetical protein